MKKIVLTVCAILGLIDSAYSQSMNLFELGYSKIFYKENDSPTFKPDHIRASLRRDRFEGILSLNVKNNEQTYLGVKESLAVPYVLGFYYRDSILLSDKLELYGRGGVARIKTEVTIPSTGAQLSTTGGGVSYGAGMSYLNTPYTKVNFDLTNYYNRQDISVRALTIGTSISFK